MRYGSVCSGIEACTAAWHQLGWQPAFFSEIEAFPSAVLKHHYPHVPNHGDMTKFKDWTDHAIDLLVGGTPCQSFSVAGLRKGMADPRGNLALTFLAIADRFRPQWVLWENVPGVLSSSGGRDFGSFLGGLGELGYGFAYRVLDAQHVRTQSHPRAVPQRRRRVFVVGHLGDWRRAAAVLFERESLQGNNPPSRKAGERPAPTVGAGPSSGGRKYGLCADSAESLVANSITCDARHGRPELNRGNLVASTGDIAHCLNAGGMGRIDYETETMIASQFAVRRLTPGECEKLQGFETGYTAVPYRGKLAADGPRYKALGNSMAVNCMAWLGERIASVDAIARRLAA